MPSPSGSFGREKPHLSALIEVNRGFVQSPAGTNLITAILGENLFFPVHSLNWCNFQLQQTEQQKDKSVVGSLSDPRRGLGARINTLYEVLYRVVLRPSCCNITVTAGVRFLWLTDSSLNSEALRGSLIALQAGGLPSLTLWLASTPPLLPTTPQTCPYQRQRRLRQTIRVSLDFRFHRVNFYFTYFISIPLLGFFFWKFDSKFFFWWS